MHIGSNVESGPAGANSEVATLNIWSADDAIVQGGNISGAENAQLDGNDHYQIATSAETFNEMYRFFNNGELPSTTEIVSQTDVEISGKVLTLGENQPRANASIKIYAVNNNDGSRINNNPDFSITSDQDGLWGPVNVTANQAYEFEVSTGQADERKVYYYREGFKRSNPLVYLRMLPPPSSFMSSILADIPSDDDQSALIVFASSQAVIEGRDNLEVNGAELSTAEFASESNSSIAFFLYDGNDNQQTDLSAQGIFANFPFLSGVDMFFQASTPESIKCELNGRELYVRNKKSDSEGIVIAVFD